MLCALLGCKKNKYNYVSQKILILGNSITYSPPNQALQWEGNWGMAATSAENDYVHRFTAEIKRLNNNNTVKVKNISKFETDFDTYNLSENLQEELAYNPDVLIIRIGENVTRTNDEALFDQKYQDLVAFFKSKNPSLKVVGVGSVWPWRELANRVMQKHSLFIPMEINYDTSNYAFGQFPNYEVQTHPSDKGMAVIADYLFLQIKPIIYPNYY